MYIKKRVLFILTYLDCGGISRSLQNFLNLYDTSKYEIDVFAIVHNGMFCGEFRNCNILKSDLIAEALISRYGQTRGVYKAIVAITKILGKLFGGSFRNKVLQRAGRKILSARIYDTVVAFSEGIPTHMVSLLNHSNKVAWIHCDYSSYLKETAGRNEYGIYSKFEKIVCVSEYTRQTFTEFFPSLSSRTIFVHNLMDAHMMRTMAEIIQTPIPDNRVFNIVSVGRIVPVKRFSLIPKIASAVINSCGRAIKWYIIGPKGGRDDEYQRLISAIKDYHMEEVISLTGELHNPYYHIAHADLLVNTSISEACPYVINESKVLGTPCVCSDFGSAREFIEDGKTGIISPVEKMAEIITSLVSDLEYYNSLKSGIESYEYDNRSLLANYYNIL